MSLKTSLAEDGGRQIVCARGLQWQAGVRILFMSPITISPQLGESVHSSLLHSFSCVMTPHRGWRGGEGTLIDFRVPVKNTVEQTRRFPVI